jgi:hypothetical protein
MKVIFLALSTLLVGCSYMPTFTPIPVKQYKTDVVSQKPCYETNDCPMQNPPAFLFLNNFNNSWRR